VPMGEPSQRGMTDIFVLLSFCHADRRRPVGPRRSPFFMSDKDGNSPVRVPIAMSLVLGVAK